MTAVRLWATPRRIVASITHWLWLMLSYLNLKYPKICYLRLRGYATGTASHNRSKKDYAIVMPFSYVVYSEHRLVISTRSDGVTWEANGDKKTGDMFADAKTFC